MSQKTFLEMYNPYLDQIASMLVRWEEHGDHAVAAAVRADARKLIEQPLQPEVPLTQLCEILGVTVHGLMRAGGHNPQTEKDGAGGGKQYTLPEWLDVLFNADSSVLDVLCLIMKACNEPLYRVRGFADGGDEERTHLGTIELRSTSAKAAAELAYEILWDPQLRIASCVWAYDVEDVAFREAKYDCGGGEVRLT